MSAPVRSLAPPAMAGRAFRHSYRKFKSAAMSALFVLSALLVVTPLVLVLYHVVEEGASALNWAFLTRLPKAVGEKGGGMGNAIAGTLELLGLALLIGTPSGVLGGVFLSEYGSPRVNACIRFCADVLNGVPSIVWGMVAWRMVVLPMRSFSVLSGAVALGFMMIPLVLRTTEEVLVLVPNNLREAALALGLPRWKAIWHVVMRTAIKGIVAGVMLALARVAGETAPLLFTAFGNRYWSHHLTEPIAALPLQIFAYAISPYADWHHQAWAGALVLLVIIFLLGIGMRLIFADRRNSG